ncbi:MAG: 30S ribosome-binding factor RbfA [Rikenellaceae bacterium]|jgi:ribosome-binding factor A|nr:30S ribosome-binding factor RbfA [Rikenellaceae bacterium]
MESTRQQKVARQIQKDISDIFMKEAAGLVRGAMVSVTVVRMSPDLALAKVYLSIFPFDKGGAILKTLNDNLPQIRRALGNRIHLQLRITPEIAFYIDDSLEYIAHIDDLLK